MEGLQILSPAGSFEALRAAVAGGADAVYFGGGGFNARQGAKNFEDAEMEQAIAYCRQNGVKSYVTVNTLISDRELEEALSYVGRLCAWGVDAVIVQDLGLMRALRSMAPELRIIASTQAAANSLPALFCLNRLGCRQAVVGRELSKEELSSLCAASPVEIEAFCHGALCYSVSGQCYLSALVGRRSANRGRCAGPCRLPYSLRGGKPRHLLSLKDNCLAEHLDELESIGVGCVKIEGRMKRPEYVYGVTKLYRTLKDAHRPPRKNELVQVQELFSRSGFTDAYYRGAPGKEMFGMREETPPERMEPLLAAQREQIAAFVPRGEGPAREVSFFFAAHAGSPARLSACCEGFSVSVSGPVPEPARSHPLSEEIVSRALSKTGGTGFVCRNVSCELEAGLMLPLSALNAMRREALSLLPRPDPAIPFTNRIPPLPPEEPVQKRAIYCRFSRSDQAPQNAALADCCFFPVHEFSAHPDALAALRDAGVRLGAALPRAARDKDFPRIRQQLAAACQAGAQRALIYNLGHLALCGEFRLPVVGDLGLNAFNSQSVAALKELGLSAVTASCELNFAQLRALHKCLPVGIFAYGRLPLMLSETCPMRNEFGCSGACQLPLPLTDRMGENLPILRDGDSCRTVLHNAKTLWLADREEYQTLPMHFSLLSFTTETADEADRVIAAYLGGPDARPADFTRGLTVRGVL